MSLSARSEASDEGASVLVTFRLPHTVVAKQVCVVGEFNNWSPTAHPMDRDGDAFVATVRMAPGRSYRFRYLIDGKRCENDWAADEYLPNEWGGDDSVIDLTSGSQPAPSHPSSAA